MERSQLRQGDVLLIPGADVPHNCEQAVPEVHDGAASYVLAHGEVTGHAHVLGTRGVTMFRDTGSGTGGPPRAFVRVTEPTDLVREEHAPLKLQPGTYEVRLQRTYRPRVDETVTESSGWRRVAD